eukprot:EST42269.1 Hypothetical protein SS50377_18569 [Spironucleus salmonicida]
MLLIQKEKYNEKIKHLDSENQILKLQISKQLQDTQNMYTQTYETYLQIENSAQTGETGIIDQQQNQNQVQQKLSDHQLNLLSFQDEINRSLPDFSCLEYSLQISLGQTKNIERKNEISDIQKELNQPKYIIHPAIRREKIPFKQSNEFDENYEEADISVLSVLKGRGRSLVRTNKPSSNLHLSNDDNPSMNIVPSEAEQIVGSVILAEQQRVQYQKKAQQAKELTESIQNYMWDDKEIQQMKIKKPILINKKFDLADTGINLHVSNAKLCLEQDYDFFK